MAGGAYEWSKDIETFFDADDDPIGKQPVYFHARLPVLLKGIQEYLIVKLFKGDVGEGIFPHMATYRNHHSMYRKTILTMDKRTKHCMEVTAS